MADITDGSSNTLAVGESVHVELYGMDAVPPGSDPGYSSPEGSPTGWYWGADCTGGCGPGSQIALGRSSRSTAYAINYTFTAVQLSTTPFSNNLPFGSYHSGGAQFVFADGHVAFLNDTISTWVYQGLSTIAGNELISADSY